MKNNNKELLKKHHFWILFGLVPLFVFIAVLVASSAVGGAIDQKAKEIAAAEAAIKSKSNPKPNILIKKMGDTIKVVDSKQDYLWTRSYSPQKSLYTMLDSPILRPLDKLKLRFGDKIPNLQNEYEEFRKKDVYRARYEKMAERVAPTVFAGGWDKILRHVNQWGDLRLTSEQIWLLLEDIWVQESLLEAVNSVNTQMADFYRVKFERDGQVIDDPADKSRQDLLHRKFKSQTWEIELDVVDEGTKRILKGKLINTTDKVQLMGIGNTMTLKVWLESGVLFKLTSQTSSALRKANVPEAVVTKLSPLKDKELSRGDLMQEIAKVLSAEEAKQFQELIVNEAEAVDRKNITPFEFKIGGEFLPGEGATKLIKDKGGDRVVPANVLEIVPSEDHVIPLGMNVSEIARVEQVFDNRTVPIRMIEAMALGFQDSRNRDLPLKMPLFFPPEEAPPTGEAGAQGPGGAGGSGGGMGGTSGSSSMAGSGLGKPPGGPGSGGMGGSGSQGNTQRTPFGGGTVASVVDGNKKRYIVEPTGQVRRMPIGMMMIVDQAYLQDVLLAFANSPLRFQITQVIWNRYRKALDTGGGSGSPSNPMIGGPGGGVAMSGFGKIGDEFGSSKMRPAGPGMGPGPGMPGPKPGGSGAFSPYGFGGSSTQSTVSEAQLTSGLIELEVYGVVSLYTSPEAPATDASKEAGAKDKEPGAKDKEPGAKDKEPGAKDKEPGAKDKEPGPKEKDKEPGSKEPMPKAPMTTDPKTPKMRVRRSKRIG